MMRHALLNPTSHMRNLFLSSLIIWVGLLAPLVYVDPLAANHVVPPYRLALFETASATLWLPPNLLAPDSTGSSAALGQVAAHLVPRSPLVRVTPGLQASLSQIHLSFAGLTLSLLLLGRLRFVDHPPTTATALAPPDEPPRQHAPAVDLIPRLIVNVLSAHMFRR